MKNKMNFAALLAMLLIAAPVFAQKVNEKVMTRAQNRIDNMCQTVKIDEAAKQEAVNLTYAVFTEKAKLGNQKSNNQISEEEYKIEDKKVTDEYWKNLTGLIPKDQLAVYKEWRSKPGKERDAAPNKE